MSNFYRRRGKRMVDIVGAFFGLVTTAPVQLAAAAMVRWKLGPPVLFKQQRLGLGGEVFEIIKFKTMTSATDSTGVLLPDQDRLPPFGHWLRSTSLDELPELWNVLRGEMSLVGPRPLLLEYLPHYSNNQMRRHEVRPGITGWAQVNGRNTLPWSQKFDLDVWYVNNYSFRVDLRILGNTFLSVIRREGISAHNHETMPRFDEKAN